MVVSTNLFKRLVDTSGANLCLALGGGGIICNFTQILPYFQLWGMYLDLDFFPVSKLSEDQKKGLHQKWKTFSSEFR